MAVSKTWLAASASAALLLIAAVPRRPHTPHTGTLSGRQVAASPIISAVTPTSGPRAGGTILYIFGTGFSPGAKVAVGDALATSVAIDSDGTLIQATAPPGASTIAITVTNPDGSAISRPQAFTYTDAPPGCGSDCGNVGDPYEGRKPPSHQIPLKSCSTKITAGGNYIVTQDIGSDPTALCLQVYYPDRPVNLDLGGHTITGKAYIQGGGRSYTLMNGSITCDAKGGECVGWYVSYGRIHHLTVENTDAAPLANINITGTVPASITTPVLEIDHVTSTVLAAPGSARTRNIMDDGANGSDPVSIPIDAHNNLVTCSDNASACQGFEFWDAPHSFVHNNRIVLPVVCSPCDDSARGIIFDENSNDSRASWNLFEVNPRNRAIRVRNSHRLLLDDNWMRAISGDGRYAAIHIGETNGGIDHDQVAIYNNTFELGKDGNGVVSDAAADVFVFDNRVVCLDPHCAGSGYLARVDVPDDVPADRQGASLTASTNDVSALTAAGRPAIHVCGPTGSDAFDCAGSLVAHTSATVCQSGQADGHGTILHVTTPPCPAFYWP